MTGIRRTRRVRKKSSEDHELKSSSDITGADDIAIKGIVYVTLKEEEKSTKKALEDARKPIEEYLTNFGKVDPKGNIVVVAPHADKDVILTKSLRVSTMLVPNAVEILKKHKFGDLIETVEVVRQDRLAIMVDKGKIPKEILDSLIETKDTYALSVKIEDRHHE